MDTSESSRPFVIAHKEAALILIDPAQQRFLLPFFARDCTVGEAAAQTRTSANTMYVRVQRFVRLGLLRVSATRARRGRAIKAYRTVADRFFVPALLVDLETIDAVQAKHDAFWEGELRRSLLKARMGEGDWGFELSRDEQGGFWIRGAPRPGERYSPSAPGAPATVYLWSEQLRLEYDDAKAFQRELLDLYHKYRAKPGSQSYLLHIGLAPWKGDWPK